MRVVFTGPAMDGNGNSIVRSNLIAACATIGIAVDKAVGPLTDVLVASRTDTVKAKAAAKSGVTVIGYPEFVKRFLSSAQVKTGRQVNLSTNFAQTKLNADLLVPCFA